MTLEPRRHALAVMCALCMGTTAMQMQPAAAQSVEQFYKGKTVTIWVGTSPGGINDITARFATKHLSHFIPGNPLGRHPKQRVTIKKRKRAALFCPWQRGAGSITSFEDSIGWANRRPGCGTRGCPRRRCLCRNRRSR